MSRDTQRGFAAPAGSEGRSTSNFASPPILFSVQLEKWYLILHIGVLICRHCYWATWPELTGHLDIPLPKPTRSFPQTVETAVS